MMPSLDFSDLMLLAFVILVGKAFYDAWEANERAKKSAEESERFAAYFFGDDPP